MNDPSNRKYFARIEECLCDVKIMKKMNTRKCRGGDDFWCPICDNRIVKGERMTIFRAKPTHIATSKVEHIACHDACVARIKMM